MSARRICFDRVLPRNIRRVPQARMGPQGRMRAIAPRSSIWVNGSKIRIRFLDGEQQHQDFVQSVVPRWTEHANLGFEFTDDPRAEIRVTFDPTDGAWSYVGTDNLEIPLHAATLNLGWLDEGVVLHEFGHMIGLAHEHSSPLGGIEWNEDAVMADLSGPPNWWDEETIRHNVIHRYSVDQIHGTEFDPHSIMLYEFPPEWTKNMDKGTHANEELSELDTSFIRSRRMYPAPESQEAPERRPRTGGAARSLGPGGVQDPGSEPGRDQTLHDFEVERPGRWLVSAEGKADVVLSVFGPDSPTRLVARDDAGVAGVGARVAAHLEPGRYVAQAHHLDPEAQEGFTFQARAL